MTNQKQMHVFVGGQFGSEAKGHALDQFVRNCLTDQQRQDLIVVRIAGPNAGHTVVHQPTGQHVALRSIPVAAVSDPECLLVIGPGSEVDLEVLQEEIDKLLRLDIDVRERLWVHEQATILTAGNRNAEGGNDSAIQRRIGSTGKGIGAARSDRIARVAPIVRDSERALWNMGVQTLSEVGWQYFLSGEEMPNLTVVIEGTQGFGLGLHAGHYPFCTSSDCRSIDFVAMAGVPPAEFATTTHVVYRTYPIRVAGNSGPLYDEHDWAQLAQQSGGYIQPELTTVTRKQRRIGGWDPMLAKRAFEANRLTADTRVWLMFADYIDPGLAGSTDRAEVVASDRLLQFLDRACEAWDVGPHGASWPYFVGTGPGTGVFT